VAAPKLAQILTPEESLEEHAGAGAIRGECEESADEADGEELKRGAEGYGEADSDFLNTSRAGARTRPGDGSQPGKACRSPRQGSSRAPALMATASAGASGHPNARAPRVSGEARTNLYNYSFGRSRWYCSAGSLPARTTGLPPGDSACVLRESYHRPPQSVSGTERVHAATGTLCSLTSSATRRPHEPGSTVRWRWGTGLIGEAPDTSMIVAVLAFGHLGDLVQLGLGVVIQLGLVSGNSTVTVLVHPGNLFIASMFFSITSERCRPR